MSHPIRLWISLLAVLPLFTATAFAQNRDAIPQQFTPVDTSRVMGSPDPEPLEAERVFPSLQFERPIEITTAGDDSNRLFVAEQEGRIQVFDNRPDVPTAEIFLDLRDVVSRKGNEEGLLGLAFSPNFKQDGHFYVYYSVDPPESIISRFSVSDSDPDRADRQSEEILLRIPQPYRNHNGGSMKFGPDGYLYIGLGDGGDANDPHGNGQDLTTLLGSILRIDVTKTSEGKKYAIPEDNPFAKLNANQSGGVRGEIWAYGLRNVWRLAFDRKTGELWAGDVGQDRFEEVDRIVRGGNYGWNQREGFHPFDPDVELTHADQAIPPVAEYFHGDGESVTGGIVYRGPRLPEFEGHYFYADYVSGLVWAVPVNRQQLAGEQQSVEESTAGMDTTSTRYARIVARTGLQIAAFGEDAQGNMYLAAFDGKLYQLKHRDLDIDQVAQAFPRKLSETGLFRDVAQLQPADGVLPYRVNLPLWSDGAAKQRMLALPEARSVTFHPQEKWEFPVGTVFIKTFFLPVGEGQASADAERAGLRSDTTDDLQRLETRLFVHSPEGWRGYTYLWNEEQTEAELLDGSREMPYEVPTDEGTQKRIWYFPSRVDCMACHSKAAGFVLGPNTRQLNLDFEYAKGHSANQIQVFDELGLFTKKVGKPDRMESYADWLALRADAEQANADTAEVSKRARAYLDVNCSMCHQPEGIERRVDLRFHTPLEKTALIGEPVRQGRLAPKPHLRVAPGKPRHSELLLRMSRRGHRQMPPLATNVEDDQALRIIREWIEEMQ